MVMVYVDVEVGVDLEEFDTSDLCEELESRDIVWRTGGEPIIRAIHQARELGKPYDQLLDELIYRTIGRIA